jgi:hypothetical protein
MKIGLKKSKKQANPAVKGGDMGAPKFDLKNISRKRLLMYVGLVLLVVASVAWLALTKENKESGNSPVVIVSEDVVNSADNLTSEELKEFASKNKPSSTSNFEQKYAYAIAVKSTGDLQDSLSAFSEAEKQLSGKSANLVFEFYDRYAVTASSAKNTQLAITNYQKSKEAFLKTDLAQKDQRYREQIVSQIDASIKDLQNGVN